MICSRFGVRSVRAAHRAAATLFPCVMRRRGFWLGEFFCWFLIGLDPFGVKDAGLIDPFVGVRAEEIALGLQEICWQMRRAIAIEVSQRCGKCGRSNAMFDCGR